MNQQPQAGIRLLVSPQRDGERLDVFLAATTKLSRRGARRAIEKGLVLRNCEVLRVQSRSLTTGDVIDVHLPESTLGVESTPPPVTITFLFEDRWLIVAAKPAGVLSQPAERQGPDDPLSFDRQVLLALAWREGQKPFLRLVHRLDRLTSGAMLFARSPEILPTLSRAWGDGRVERYYLAVIEGRPDSDAFAIDDPIARDRDHQWRFRRDHRGKPSRTDVEVLATLEDDLSVVGCRLVTGRTHQVRVHLASSGYPVLGDRLYGSKRAELAGRPLLHAAALTLPHPATGDMFRVACRPPPDIAQFLPADFHSSEF